MWDTEFMNENVRTIKIPNEDVVDGRNLGTQRQRIVKLLKINPKLSLKELAEQLDLSKMGARKHLQVLEEKQLVQKEYFGEGVGRPKVYYSLTPQGSKQLISSYAGLSCTMLHFIQDKLGDEGVHEALLKRQQEVIEDYRSTIPPEKPLSEKVKELARLRERDGYMVELNVINEIEYILEEYNCPILEVAQEFSVSCSLENELFTEVLDAKVETTHTKVSGNNICRFRINAL